MRDRLLNKHQRMRLIIYADIPEERQLRQAKRLLSIAVKQQRFQLYLFAHLWMAKLKKENAGNFEKRSTTNQENIGNQYF